MCPLQVAQPPALVPHLVKGSTCHSRRVLMELVPLVASVRSLLCITHRWPKSGDASTHIDVLLLRLCVCRA